MPRKIPAPEPSASAEGAAAPPARRRRAATDAPPAGTGRGKAAAGPAGNAAAPGGRAAKRAKGDGKVGAASGVAPAGESAGKGAGRPVAGSAAASRMTSKTTSKTSLEAGSNATPKPAPKAASKAGVPAQPAAAPAGRPRRAPAEAAAPAPARRNKAVANAAAAAHGRTLAAWSAAEIAEAFARFEAQDPEPKGELNHADAFTLLVAVVLSAQATDAGVNKATRGLFAAAATPAAMVALGEEEVARHIRSLGLYRNKAKNVVALSRLLLERHRGIVPQDRAALEALPGVGRKTANVVLNIAFGAPTIAVDTHLFRVANRTGLAPGATPLAVEEGLEARIPDHFKLHAHHWLILHGRYICKARLPECGRCIIADLCRWPDKHF